LISHLPCGATNESKYLTMCLWSSAASALICNIAVHHSLNAVHRGATLFTA
jgi:hypothetical protein